MSTPSPSPDPTSPERTGNERTTSERTSNDPACCRGLNAQGQPCGSPARPGSTFCFRHDPERTPVQRAGRDVEPPNLELHGPITNAAALRELLAGMIHYAATSPAPDLARIHAISSLAGPLLRSFDKQEVEHQLAAAQAQLRTLQEAHDHALTELATVRARTAPPSTQELADAKQRAARAEGALAATADERQELESELAEAQQEIEMLTSHLSTEVQEHQQVATALKDTTLVDRLCLPCINLLRGRRILGPPAHEDDPDWNWPRRR